MSVTDGVESLLGIEATPGLNPHAQAEPAWLPVWTVNGDDARWESWGITDDGEWRLEAEPEAAPGAMPRLEVQVTELGAVRGVNLCPESAMALMAAIQKWLASLEETGGVPEPRMPDMILADDPLARRLVARPWPAHNMADLRGAAYRRMLTLGGWRRVQP